MIDLPDRVTSADDVRTTLRAIVQMTDAEHPFLARLAQLALQSKDLVELEASLTSLYRVSLEQPTTFLPDIIDTLLHCVERAREDHLSALEQALPLV
jgi:hypothetical protein